MFTVFSKRRQEIEAKFGQLGNEKNKDNPCSEMRKAACNRSRLSNVIDSDIYMQRAGQAMTSPASLATFSPVEKKVCQRRKRTSD